MRSGNKTMTFSEGDEMSACGTKGWGNNSTLVEIYSLPSLLMKEDARSPNQSSSSASDRNWLFCTETFGTMTNQSQ